MAKEIGVNVLFNGHIYHFDNDVNLDGCLEQCCESVKETDRENAILYDDELKKCRVCGCTDDFACPGGCYWVEEDLCSECVEMDQL